MSAHSQVLKRILIAAAAAAVLALPAVASASPAVHHAHVLPVLKETPQAVTPLDVDDIAICTTVVTDECIQSYALYHDVDYASKFANTATDQALDFKAANICSGDNKVTATCPFTDTATDSAYLGDYIQTIEFWDAGSDNQYVTSDGTTGTAWDASVGSTASTFVNNPIGSNGNFRLINVWYTNNGSSGGVTRIYLGANEKVYNEPLILAPSFGTGQGYTWYDFSYVPSNPMAKPRP